MRRDSTARLGDLILPAAVLAVVGMMVFPLPVVLLDLLLTCNIAFALLLLVAAVYLTEPSGFTALPTVLLLTTLFRLGLNISTTRYILSNGSAPEIVQTFGLFAVDGSLVVGCVVFLIITLVQFLVIAKGAERVAEVSARFTLDALPGKQMSIDADVRAGLMTIAEARERRVALQRESKLYGALDGAMKFVKGDAIAGLVITAVNIVAGFIVGVTLHDQSFAEAARTYTLFTVGDGLVSQIPALLVAVAAGIVVTRVEDSERRLVGRELVSQLSREPQALYTCAVVLAALGLIPGLPTIPFLGAASLLFLTTFKLNGPDKRPAIADASFTPKIFAPVVVKVNGETARLLHDEQVLVGALQQLRTDLFEQLGILVPEIQFDLEQKLSSVACDVWIHHASTGERLLEAKDITPQVVEHLRMVLLQNRERLLDDTAIRTLLDLHQPHAEDLIQSLVPQQVSVTALTTLLRQLVRESVSIRDLRSILQALAEYFLEKQRGVSSSRQQIHLQFHFLRSELAEPKAHDPALEILISVRERIRHIVCRDLQSWQGSLRLLTIPPQSELALARAAACGMPIDPALVEPLRAAWDRYLPTAFLVSPLARLWLYDALLKDLPAVRVLSYSEVDPHAPIELLSSGETEANDDGEYDEEAVACAA